ncbi:hypothetical protein G9A89_002407 [Geosiphon pyriformis]|nr:hypothetical protein G9A89_002407 [Geosiphon pyriformis]
MVLNYLIMENEMVVEPKKMKLKVDEIIKEWTKNLMEVWSNCIEVYTNRSLKSAGSVKVTSGVTAYFSAINMSIGVKVYGFLSSTLTELQVIALVLEYIPFFCVVILYLDSQSAINAYVLEISFAMLEFHNYCWIKRLHIVNLIKNKDILVK